MAAHSGLTGADLHEPKGIASANAGDVYVADGAGTGAFIAGANRIYLTLRIDDVSTAGQEYVVVPFAGTVTKLYSVISGALGTADVTLTPKISAVAITSGAITITQSGSAEGDVDNSTPSAANTVTAGQAIEVETDGASTNTISATVTIVVDIS